jgi:hypothetical protein
LGTDWHVFSLSTEKEIDGGLATLAENNEPVF